MTFLYEVIESGVLMEKNLEISDKYSWKMFRGNSMRTGVSASNISRKPSLLWVIEVGPVVSSPYSRKEQCFHYYRKNFCIKPIIKEDKIAFE